MLLPKELGQLKHLEKKHVLLPVGADHPFSTIKKKKAPCNRQGGLLKGWNKPEQKGFSVNELWNYQSAIAVGIRCDNLFVLDIDGETANSKVIDLGLGGGADTWTIRRNSDPHYYKRIFLPTKEQINAIPPNSKGKKELHFRVYTKEEKDSREAIEFFGHTPGRQVIVQGQHFSTNGRYTTRIGEEPKDLRPPTVREWNIVLRLARQYAGEKVPPPGLVLKNKTSWKRLAECPICNRNERVVCSISEDRQTISCFHGLTFYPPTGLRKGEVLFGTWAYSKTEERSFGTFSTFVRHRPSSLELLNRRLQISG